MTEDRYRHSIDSPMTPAENCFAITPDDAADLSLATKAIYIGESGDVTLVTMRGSGPVTFRNLPAGSILDVRVRSVKATGTTARYLVGLA